MADRPAPFVDEGLGDNILDGDTIQDVMNVPGPFAPSNIETSASSLGSPDLNSPTGSGNFTLPYRPRSLSSGFSTQPQGDEDDSAILAQRRADVEANVEDELDELAEREEEEEGDLDEAGPLGVVLVDWNEGLEDNLDEHHGDEEASILSDHTNTGSDHRITAQTNFESSFSMEPSSKLPLDLSIERARQTNSSWEDGDGLPKITSRISSLPLNGSATPTFSPRIPSSILSPRNPASPKSATATPIKKRVSFSSEVPTETPFTGALKYFREFKPKNRVRSHSSPDIDTVSNVKKESPSRSRRNAYLPSEIEELAEIALADENIDLRQLAEVVHEANNEEENKDLEALDKDREADLAPFSSEDQRQDPVSEIAQSVRIYELKIPGHWGDAIKMKVQTNASEQDVADYIRERATELEADEETIDRSVAEFLEDPPSFIVHSKFDDIDERVDKIDKNGDEHPVFINVISMMPMTMFWTVAAPVTKYTNMVFDLIVEKLTKMALRNGKSKDA